MPRRTKEEAEGTREALLEVAGRVFLERGVARATLEEVARVAGVTRGALYWHFRDKLDLFLALDERARLPHEDLAEQLAADPSLDPFIMLDRRVEEAFAALDADAERRRLHTVLLLRCEYVNEMAPALERQRRADAALLAEMERIFGLIAARGRLAPPWRPESAAFAAFALLNGVIQAWLRGAGCVSLVAEGAEAMRGFLHTLDRGAAAEPPAREGGTPAEAAGMREA